MITEEEKTVLTKTLEEKNINFTPSIEIRIDKLIGIPLIELETNNTNGIYTQVRRAIKPVVNYRWDNNILKVSNIFGDLFSIHIYLAKNKALPSGWSITIWDYKGTKTVGTWHKKYESDNDRLTREEINSIKNRLEDFSRDILHCSDCQTTMPTSKHIILNSEVHKQEYGGQYYAGHYCKDCWERKWKAIEAKENYE